MPHGNKHEFDQEQWDSWPDFEEELSIPYDEYMLAVYLSEMHRVAKKTDGVSVFGGPLINEWIAKNAKPASKILHAGPIKARCYLCHKPANDDMFCSGCKKHVCDSCDQTGVMGDHDVIEHQINEDDDED